MIVKGKFCDLKLLKPKDYNKLYNLRSKLKNINLFMIFLKIKFSKNIYRKSNI